MIKVKLENVEYETEYYKDIIRPYIKSIDMINFSKSNDLKIQKAFLKRLITVEGCIKKNGVFKAQTCLFDRIFDAQEGDRYAIDLLTFIDQSIYGILKNLDGQFWSEFENILVQLFINFDETTSQYLERIGEIAVLDKILMSGKIVLKDIEYRLNNGKCIDFAVQYVNDQKDINEITLLEVFNMHIEMGKVSTAEELRRYFENRLLEKINSKLNGLDKSVIKNFSLVPVLWGNLDDFMTYGNVFDWFNEYKPCICSPQGIFYCHLKNDETVYIFDTIENIVKRQINDSFR